MSSSGNDDHTDLHHEGHITSSLSPRFFKVIVEDTLRTKKLMLPKKFTTILQQERGSDLPNTAKLGLPNGTIWEMEATVDDHGGVWLRNGFMDFAEFCSLEHGCVLLFKHRGEFHFSVRVYGITTVEIQFPSSDSPPTSHADLFPDRSSGSAGGDDEDSDSDSDYSDESSRGEFEGGRRGCWKKKEKKKDIAGSSRYRGGGETWSYSGRERPPSSTTNTSIGVAPSFTATMTETYISLRQAYIPREFSEKYMKESERVGLKVGERVWEMKLTKLGGAERKRKNTRITGGWTSFARDNKLKIGDVCVFQLFDDVVDHHAATASTSTTTTTALPRHHRQYGRIRRPLLHVTILRNPRRDHAF